MVLPSPFSPRGLRSQLEAPQLTAASGIYADFTVSDQDYTVQSPEAAQAAGRGPPVVALSQPSNSTYPSTPATSTPSWKASRDETTPQHQHHQQSSHMASQGSGAKSRRRSSRGGFASPPLIESKQHPREPDGVDDDGSGSREGPSLPLPAPQALTPVAAAPPARASIAFPDKITDDICDRALAEEGKVSTVSVDVDTLTTLTTRELERLCDFMDGLAMHQSSRLVQLLEVREELKDRVSQGQALAAEHIRLAVTSKRGRRKS